MRDEASKRGGKEGGCEKERGNVAGRKEGRKEVEEEKMIGSESRTCNEKGLMNGEGIKEKREERNRVGRRGTKLGKEGGKKRETGQEVKERERVI